MPLLEVRAHTDGCAKLQHLGRAAAAAAASSAAAHAHAPAPAPNRSTFRCPFCEADHLPRADLLEHLRTAHADCYGRPAVCPVCAAMPWGDASYQSANLIQHMMMRHQFDYDSTADFGESEDDVLPPRPRGLAHRLLSGRCAPPLYPRRGSRAAAADVEGGCTVVPFLTTYMSHLPRLVTCRRGR